MDSRSERLQFLVGDQLTTAKIAKPGQGDGIIWHTARLEMSDGVGHEGNPGGGLGHEGNPGGGLGHEGNPGGGLGHEGNAGGGSGHEVRMLIEQFALEDEGIGKGNAVSSLDVLLGRLDTLAR